MSTSEIIAGVMNSEAILLVCAILLVAATALYLEYIIRRWSWVPRKRQRKYFTERY